jgi:hypothetical protein
VTVVKVAGISTSNINAEELDRDQSRRAERRTR